MWAWKNIIYEFPDLNEIGNLLNLFRGTIEKTICPHIVVVLKSYPSPDTFKTVCWIHMYLFVSFRGNWLIWQQVCSVSDRISVVKLSSALDVRHGLDSVVSRPNVGLLKYVVSACKLFYYVIRVCAHAALKFFSTSEEVWFPRGCFWCREFTIPYVPTSAEKNPPA